jgi:hypothetical protein
MAEQTFEGVVSSIPGLLGDCMDQLWRNGRRRLFAGNIGQPASSQVVAERKYDKYAQPK